MKRLLALSAALLASASPAQESASFEGQVAEYIRLFPYQATYDYTMRFTGGDPANLNTWLPKGEPALARPGGEIVPRTNRDTFYKGAALWLTNGPVILESAAPSRERFNSFQLVDDRNVNYRNIVFPSGKYTLYFGKTPEHVEGELIEVPSAFSVVIARVEVRDEGDPRDVAAARSLYAGLTMSGTPLPELRRLDLLSRFTTDVVREANRRLEATFAAVPFRETVAGPGKEPGRDVSFLFHSAGTKAGWGGPDPAHSSYDAILFDRDGREMRGVDGPYQVTTEAPPVDAFWSVTVYDTERGGHLHPNTHDRYHINATTAVRNADGTVTFLFKQQCGATDSNCLDVPASRFDVTARYYLPREPIIAGTWRFPAIIRQHPGGMVTPYG
jgi:hypothetical protein